MKRLDFELRDGTIIRARHALIGRSVLRIWPEYIVTPAGHRLVFAKGFCRLGLADVRRVYQDHTIPLTLTWDRDNPEQATRNLRWIVRLRFETPTPR